MSKHIPEIYGTIFGFLTQKQLIEIIKLKGDLAFVSLLYYPWKLDQRKVCDVFSKSDMNILMKNQNIVRYELFECCMRKRLYDKVLILLKDPNIDFSVLNNKPLINIYRTSQRKVVEMLLAWRGSSEKWVDPRVKNNQAIIYASNAKIVKLLLAWRGPNGERVDPRDQNNQAIIGASGSNKNEIVKLLLAWRGPNGERVDPSDQHNEAIIRASLYGNFSIIRELLAWTPKVPVKGKGPLGERVEGHSQNYVLPTDQNNKAIMYASLKGHYKVVKLLLDWIGPNEERVDPSGQYNLAITYASMKGHYKVVKLLLDWKGPNGERINPNGPTVNASVRGRYIVTKLLSNWRGPTGAPLSDREGPMGETEDWLGPDKKRSNISKPVIGAFVNGYYRVVKLLSRSPMIQYKKNLDVLNTIYNAYTKQDKTDTYHKIKRRRRYV